jgi:hypothetical protein
MSEMAHTVPANALQTRNTSPRNASLLERREVTLAMAAVLLPIVLVAGTCWLVCHCLS